MKHIKEFSVTASLGILVLVILWSCSGSEQPWVRYSPPASEGFSADSLKKIDDLIAGQVADGKIPGAAALVARKGKVVYETVYGFRDIAAKTNLRQDDIFRIASMTKPLTSVAIMQLYEKNKIRLDDPVSKYIPSFTDPAVLDSFNPKDTTYTSKPASREITIHDLLTHTSGIQYGFGDPVIGAIYAKNGIPDLSVAYELTTGAAMEKLGDMPLAHDPGEKFTYGLNTDVLGRIVEVASGMTLSEYFQVYITGPLKMKDTRFFFEEEYADRLTSAYMMNLKDSLLFRIEKQGIYDGDYPVRGAKSYFSGGAGLCSTVKDYFVFCQAIMNGGEYNGIRILQDSTVKLMCSDQLGKLKWSETSSFGYGFRINHEKNADGTLGAVTDLGWGGAFSTWFTINPKDKVIEIIMTQVLANPNEAELNNGFDTIVKRALQE